MLKTKWSNAFHKDFKKFMRHKSFSEIVFNTMLLIAAEEKLPDRLKDHPLSGNYAGYRECHVMPDLLLIYKIDKAMNRVIDQGKIWTILHLKRDLGICPELAPQILNQRKW